MNEVDKQKKRERERKKEATCGVNRLIEDVACFQFVDMLFNLERRRMVQFVIRLLITSDRQWKKYTFNNHQAGVISEYFRKDD